MHDYSRIQEKLDYIYIRMFLSLWASAIAFKETRGAPKQSEVHIALTQKKKEKLKLPLKYRVQCTVPY